MLKPLGDRILVKRVEQANKTSAGIYIPDTAKDKSMEGVVVAVGPGAYENGTRKKPAVNEGDRVVFGRRSGDEITYNNEEYVMLTEANIIGILQER